MRQIERLPVISRTAFRGFLAAFAVFSLSFSSPCEAATTVCKISLPQSCVGKNGWGSTVVDNYDNASGNPAVCMGRAQAYFNACGFVYYPMASFIPAVTANYLSGTRVMESVTYPTCLHSSSGC
jgi:hypothetical protein